MFHNARVLLGQRGQRAQRGSPCPHFTDAPTPSPTGRLALLPNGLCRFRSVACPLLSSVDEHDDLRRGPSMLARDRILVVDDNESIRSILAEALEDQGFRVSTAADGQSAWDLVRRMPFAYDLVLTDMMMPAMDGIALLSKIMMDSPWLLRWDHRRLCSRRFSRFQPVRSGMWGDAPRDIECHP
jgi:CheY-like chemotaxis protein